MENFKKSHLWGGLFFLFLFVFINFIPKISKAAQGDYQTFQVRNTDVYRVTGLGRVVPSSGGISNDRGLWIRHESVTALAASSGSFYSGPDAKISTSALIGTNGSAVRGATTYVETDPAFTQPRYPRTISLEVFGASGSAVVKGTDTFNRLRTETLFFISTQAVRGIVPWIGISSFTINFDTLQVQQTSVTFNIGSGPGYGLPFRVDNTTDIFKILEAGVYRSSFTASNSTTSTPGITIAANSSFAASSPIVNTTENTINLSSTTFGGGKSLDIWAIVRKSIFSPPTPSDSVIISTP